MTNAKGRLAEAFTCTYGVSSCVGNVIADELFGYSSRGELTDVYESTPHSGGYYHTTASYWPNGAVNTLGGVPGLSSMSFTPDGEGRPTSTTYGTTHWVSSTAFNAASQPTNVTFGKGDTDVYGYDGNTGRMNSFQFNLGSTVKSLTGTPGWNANGSLGSLNITDQFNTSNVQNCTYMYDDLGRSSNVTCKNGANTVWTQGFTLDAFGNISKSGTGSFVALYNANNRETNVGGLVPTYDADGNMTYDPSGAGHHYAWDADGNSVTVDTVNLTYDALHRQVEIASGSTYTQILYGPTGKLGLMNGQTASTTRFPLPGGSTVELIGSTGSTQHVLHPDWLGSVRLASSYAARDKAADHAYAPYGEHYVDSPTMGGDLNFTGQSQDTVSGLYDFLYRRFSPAQGRWISPDPAGMGAVDPSDPQTWNRYAYVSNNPLSFIDPSGDSQCSVVIGGITQTPNTPNVANQTAFANNVGVLAFPNSGEDGLFGYAQGAAEVASQGIFGGNQNTNVSIAAITYAAKGVDAVNIFAISGGAQSFATALQYLPADVRTKINNVTYIFPVGVGDTLPMGGGATTVISSNGLTDLALVSNVPLVGVNQITVNCGFWGHSANCAFKQAGGQLAKLAGGPCPKHTPFTKGGGGAGGRGVGGGGFLYELWLNLYFYPPPSRE